jgi:hypothetical protein
MGEWVGGDAVMPVRDVVLDARGARRAGSPVVAFDSVPLPTLSSH